MDLETLLTETLTDRADAVPRTPGAWEDNRRRVRRDRRRRTAAVGVAAALAVGGGTAGLLLRDGPESTLQVATPKAYTVDGYALLAPPAKVGTLDVGGQVRDVVVFLGTPRGRTPSGPVACAAVTEADGRVTKTSPVGPCLGPAEVQGGSPFVLELLPLTQSGLPARPCSYGPLGNLDLALVAPQTTGVTMTTGSGREVPYALVPGTGAWPLRLFAGTVPQGELAGGFRLVSGTTVLQDDLPTRAEARGCPSTGG